MHFTKAFQQPWRTWLQILSSGGLLCLLSGNGTLALAQATTAANAANQGASSVARESATSNKQKAYLRFLEARQLRAEAINASSQTRLDQKTLDKAIEAYRDTIWLDPKAAEPHVDLGEIYFFFRNDVTSAEREAVEAVKLDDQCVGAHQLLARLSIALFKFSLGQSREKRTPAEERETEAQFNRAIQEYETVVKLNPTDTEGWALLADLYRTKDDLPRYTQALERWASAPLPSDPTFYRWFSNADLTPDQAFAQLSQVYLAQGKKREAFDAARRAYEFDPENNQYGMNLIATMADAKPVPEALKLYARLSRTAPSATLEWGYGATLMRALRYPEAIERLREPAKAFGREGQKNATAVVLLAKALRRLGQAAGAVETLVNALTRADNNNRAELQFALAETYEELGRNDDAVTLYEQMIERLAQNGVMSEQAEPQFQRVVTALTRVLRLTGNQAKWQATLTRAKRLLDDHNPLVETLTIESLREEGKFREALDLAQATIRRVPEDKNLRLTEVMLLGDLRQFKEAEERLLNLLSGKPEQATLDAIVQLVLSSVQLQAKQLKEAEAAARKALTLNQSFAGATLQLSSVLDRSGQRTEAESLLRNLLQREPDNATALNNLGYQLVEQNAKLPEALALIEQAVAIEPLNGSFLDSLGWAHYKLGDFERARTTLERAASFSRRSAAVQEHLGDTLAKLGKPAEARRAWEKALNFLTDPTDQARLKEKIKKGK